MVSFLFVVLFMKYLFDDIITNFDDVSRNHASHS